MEKTVKKKLKDFFKRNLNKTVKVTINYTPAIEEIINQLSECGNPAKKVSYNTIEIVVNDMNPQELVLMGMMVKSCENAMFTKYQK